MRQHYEREADALRERLVRLESQLPEGMRHCTIEFVECPRGHGRLRGTNWTDSGCPHCVVEGLRRINRAHARTIAELRVSQTTWRQLALDAKKAGPETRACAEAIADEALRENARMRVALTLSTVLAGSIAIVFCTGPAALVLTILAVAVHAWGTR